MYVSLKKFNFTFSKQQHLKTVTAKFQGMVLGTPTKNIKTLTNGVSEETFKNTDNKLKSLSNKKFY